MNIKQRSNALLVFAAVMFFTKCAASAEQSNWIVQLKPASSVAETRSQFNRLLGRELRVGREYSRVIQGFITELSEQEASQLLTHEAVLRMEKDIAYPVLGLGAFNNSQRVSEVIVSSSSIAPGITASGLSSGDPVIDLIQADSIWDGSATNNAGHFGEGVIVGTTGTGISGSHPSFAAAGDDGYAHINPLGDGVYLGECLDGVVVCNAKLIGRYNLTSDPDTTSEDPNGAGNSVAQAVGNRLLGSNVADVGVTLVSGIAPHANLIAYRTCNASVCQLGAILAAFEQAVIDNVDVLIHYIGSSAELPWSSIQGDAALALRASGVSLTYITGNQGPAPGSLNLSVAAPWTATFISSTHGRSVNVKRLTGFSGGDGPPPEDMFGGSVSGTLTANIVYAGSLGLDVPDAGLCLEPFPAGTLNGEILVCDRGQIARVQKALNAIASGAGGLVLANVEGENDSVNADFFAIPGIHLNAADSTVLRSWLSTGDNHSVTIAFSDDPFDAEIADRLSDRNGRGPNMGLEYLAPSVTVPALNILTPDGQDSFVVRDGLAAAAGAGAIALLESARPLWSEAEVLSALMTTAVAPLSELDGMSVTVPFDHGGGRIDVASAVQAGLLLDESPAGFAAANPQNGGEPSRLNLAGLVDLNCLQRCAWTRVVKATVDGTWDATVDLNTAGVDVTVNPPTFNLDAGESQELVIEFDLAEQLPGVVTGRVMLMPDAVGASQTVLTLNVEANSDTDLDGVANSIDNCTVESNADQIDSDADGFGNRCDTDLNNDGITNFLDLAVFTEQLEAGNLTSDFNNDFKVDFLDLAVLRDYFLLSPGPTGLL